MYKAYRRRTDWLSGHVRNKYLDVVNARLTKMKYCTACDIYRPPRTIHCGTCGCCIERLDHHCPWLGTCVGKRNYKYFITFLWSAFASALYALVVCSIHVHKDLSPDGSDSLTARQIVSIVLIVFTSILGLFVFFLCGYHHYLLGRNETTNENLKHSYEKLGNPFAKGTCDNLCRLFSRDKRNWIPTDIHYQE